ncbi:MAG: ABC transporter permease [Bacillota bacterium]
MSINPVLSKELKDRVRTWRSPAIVLLYNGVLAVIGGLFYFMNTRFSVGGPQTLRLGIQIFSILLFLQLVLIAFIAPGMTAGIISGERERQTLPLLLVTRLSPLAVVGGKLLSAVSYVLLLIIVSLPLYSIVFLFGGVSLAQLLQSAGILLVTTLTLGSIGIFLSAFFQRTVIALVVSYAIAFLLLLGTIFLGLVISELTRVPGMGAGIPPKIVYLSPLMALGSILPEGSGLPFLGNVPSMPFWQGNLIADICIIILTLGLAVWRIQPLHGGNRRGE